MHTDTNKMELPKINKRRLKSRTMQTLLKLELLSAIVKVEKDNDYEFESYEVDNIMLEIIKQSHESYLSSRFGHNTI